MNTPTSHNVSREPSAEHAWAKARTWLIEELRAMPNAAVLDLGPAGLDTTLTPDSDVECAQVHVLHGDVYLVRLSTDLMEHPRLAGYSVPRSVRNRWRLDDRFDDCTHGYLVSASAELIADICIGCSATGARGGIRGPWGGVTPRRSRLGDAPDLSPRSAPNR